MWSSHCEVELQRLENNALPEDATPLDVLSHLKEELDGLESARAEIRDLGRALVQQRVPDVQQQLDDYLKIEDEVLLRLAQMQVRYAQKEQDRLLRNVLSPTVETVSISDSGVYSYTEREASLGSAARLEKTPPPPPPAPPRSSPEATGAKSRTYADVAKSPSKAGSPVRSPPPPPVSVKSDTQRQLELALTEWRQRLARLDHLIKTSNLDDAPVDAANDIVWTSFKYDFDACC